MQSENQSLHVGSAAEFRTANSARPEAFNPIGGTGDCGRQPEFVSDPSSLGSSVILIVRPVFGVWPAQTRSARQEYEQWLATAEKLNHAIISPEYNLRFDA